MKRISDHRSDAFTIHADARRTEGSPVWVERATVPGAVGRHDHDFGEVALVCGGQGVHRTPRGTHRLRAGDLILVPPGAWHAYERCRRLSVLNWGYDAALLRGALAWMRFATRYERLLWPTPDAAVAVVHLVEPDRRRVERLARHRRTLRGDQHAGQLAVLLQLFEIVADQPSAPRRTGPPLHQAVAKALEALHGDMTEAWTADAISDIAGVDPAYLRRLFKRHLGLPPLAYLQRLRLEHAASMLLGTSHEVGRIGADVGFHDANYFARLFRHTFGHSPTAFRAQRVRATASGDERA